MATITASNSTYILTVPEAGIAQFLQGYATDAAFDTDGSDSAEIVIGVDGKMSAGYVPYMTNQTIHLQADSASVTIFEAWLAAEKAVNEKFIAGAIISIPSTKKQYICTKGYLKTVSQMPNAHKTLQSRDFVITWENIAAVPYGI